MNTNTKRGSTTIAVGAFTCFLFYQQASALPLPALDDHVAGESDQGSFTTPEGQLLQVDWLVTQAPASDFYLYQVENPSGSGAVVNSFSVFFNTALAGLHDVGFLSGSSLDEVDGGGPNVPHNNATFANLSGELNDELPVDSVGWDATVHADRITWTHNGGGLAAGYQSVTLSFISEFSPVYGDAEELGSTGGSPWGSLAAGGQKVPVPLVAAVSVPDGGLTFALLGLALVGLGSLRRSSKK